MDKLKAAGCDRILVVPLFPQYSASATAAALDAVYAARAAPAPGARACGPSTASTTIPGYIKALARNVNDYWMKQRAAATGS